MVTITGYHTREDAQGNKRVFLELEGSIRPQISATSGRVYFRTLKTNVLATVDEVVAKDLIGLQMKGSIKQVRVDPYVAFNPTTGEEYSGTYRYEYVLDDPESINE